MRCEASASSLQRARVKLCMIRSTPPRIGAVLVDEDGLASYTDCEPPPKLLKQFKERNDNQIASLEMLAIAYGTRIDVCRAQCIPVLSQVCPLSQSK